MPIQGRKSQTLIFLLSVLAILAIDQYSKYLISTRVAVGQSVPLIKNILHITFINNTGAAFGLFKNSTQMFIVISIIAIIFILSTIIAAIKKRGFLSNYLLHIGLILILSGSIGNLIDRLRFGYVIDFIDVRIWPVFNIADTSITIGAFLLTLSFISEQQHKHC